MFWQLIENVHKRISLYIYHLKKIKIKQSTRQELYNTTNMYFTKNYIILQTCTLPRTI